MNDLAEQYVIGALMIDTKVISKIYDFLKADMFIDPLLGIIYKDIVQKYELGETVNIVSIVQSVECEGFPREIIIETIRECSSAVVISGDIYNYASSVVSEWKARALRERLQRVFPSASSVENDISELIQDLEAFKKNEKSKARKLRDIIAEHRNNYFKDRDITALNTGFLRLDNITGGLEGGDVIVVGARPAVGKSAFITQIMKQMASKNKKIGFFNLEMSESQVYERLLSNEGAISLTRIRKATKFLGDEENRFKNANTVLEELEIVITNGSKSIADIRHESRHQDYDCIIIDYLQLIRADVRYGNRASEVGAISKAIKALAMELNIPVILLSQLNRTSEIRETKEPSMNELRESGDIEQDASIIILMWNLDDEQKRKGLKIDKNRQGAVGKIVYHFDGREMKFVETDEGVSEQKRGLKGKTPFDTDGFIRGDNFEIPFD